DIAIYSSLFLSAFTAATLLPGSSEALLAGFTATDQGSPVFLLTVATAGNVSGSAVNWALGRFLIHYRDRKWFPVSERRYNQAKQWYERVGLWSLLFAWLPIIGDPLTVIAGALRTRFILFLILVSIGKFGRYLFIISVTLAWFGQANQGSTN
ncbi:MAG: DedA family protein, partial [Proteobacteria bacterium]|nr:DedA family protein [Pseudomonadota bacterium]